MDIDLVLRNCLLSLDVVLLPPKPSTATSCCVFENELFELPSEMSRSDFEEDRELRTRRTKRGQEKIEFHRFSSRSEMSLNSHCEELRRADRSGSRTIPVNEHTLGIDLR